MPLSDSNHHFHNYKLSCIQGQVIYSRILTGSWDGTAKVWYTPEAIYEWLKTAPIPPLSADAEEKKELGIE